MGAMRASVGKVERGKYIATSITLYLLTLHDMMTACYAFQIRGSEYPKEMYQSIIRDQQARFEEGRKGDDDA